MRITERDRLGGTAVYLNTDTAAAREKLAAYEDTGLEPEEIEAMLVTVRAMLRDWRGMKKI